MTEGWIFLNSSLSEGLPLALGEAGLAGLPVVCTDVGGSKEVVTGPGGVFGAIVPPRRPDKIAIAQLIMAMLGPIGKLVEEEASGVPSKTFADFAGKQDRIGSIVWKKSEN